MSVFLVMAIPPLAIVAVAWFTSWRPIWKRRRERAEIRRRLGP